MVTTPAAPDAEIWGFADLHSHPFSYLGFGGLFIHGEAFPSSPPLAIAPEQPAELDLQDALPWCDYAPGFPLLTKHGPGGLNDALGNILSYGNPLRGHWVGGASAFEGWPRWNSLDHQQMYYEWIERAWLGGMRLLVVRAVSNDVLCSLVGRIYTSHDMPAVDRQIATAYAMQAFIDSRSGGPGQGWFRIVTSGTQARHVINQGKLAVVLGIEVDHLFGCKNPPIGTPCSEAFVASELARYRQLGVRHVFPIHVFDNQFGGASMYNDMFYIGNPLATGSIIASRDCASEGYEFQIDLLNANPATQAFRALTGQPFPVVPAADALCNATGLTPLGEFLIQELMDQKMIIEVDHMSKLATDRTVQLARGRGYPLVGGHTGFVDISLGARRHEGNKTGAQVDDIRGLCGVVAPILEQGHQHESISYGNRVSNDCSGSSKSWAQAYLYAVDRMRGGGVALGSDANGLISLISPRFNPGPRDPLGRADACMGESTAVGFGGRQGYGIAYPFTAYGTPQVLEESRVGSRVFDCDFDGVAHIGMLPDFIEDLRNVGLSNADLIPLFHSAEAYVSLGSGSMPARRPRTPTPTACSRPATAARRPPTTTSATAKETASATTTARRSGIRTRRMPTGTEPALPATRARWPAAVRSRPTTTQTTRATATSA